MQKDRILVGLCLLYFLTLFLRFFPPGSVIMLGIIAAYSLFFYNSPKQKVELLKTRPAIWFMLLFATWILISAVTSVNTGHSLRTLTLRLPLIIFPFTLGLIQVPRSVLRRILVGFAVIVTVAVLVSFSFATTRYFQTGLEFWLYNDSVSWLIGQQSIYTSLLVNMSFFILLSELSGGSWHRPAIRLGLVISLLLLFILNYLLASRNMMAILYAGILLFVFHRIFRKRKYLQGAALLTLMAAMITGAFLLFPDTVNRFRELGYTGYDYGNRGSESHYAGTLTADQWNGANFRLAAWSCGLQLVRENPLFGTGIGDKQDELNRVYKERGFRFAIDKNRNVHNNYLDIAFSTGIPGLLMFCLGWLLLPLSAFARRKRMLSTCILLLLAVATVTENYFDRSQGGLIFGFLVCLLLAGEGFAGQRVTLPSA